MKSLTHFAGAPVPDAFELVEMTADAVPSCHIYMEAQIFTPDSRRMVIHRSAHPHGSDPLDPAHRYLCCDLANRTSPVELTQEVGATAPAVSPDGEWLYYFVGALDARGGVVRLRRVRLDGGGREELFALDQGPSGRFYPLSTISSDGRRLAVATNLAGSGGESALWCFDLERGSARMLLRGMNFGNLHMQYCRSASQPHLLMIQQNHGCLYDADGKELRAHCAALDGGIMRKIPIGATPEETNTGLGIDLHLVDDCTGSLIGSLPVGRDGEEFCQGHQCWRGRSEWIISSNIRFSSPSTAIHELIESAADPGEHHRGAAQGSARNVLTRGISEPHFLHFATDLAGTRIVSDFEDMVGNEWHLYLGELGRPGEDHAQLRRILNLGLREKSPYHPHPTISPDGSMLFFNSSAEGVLRPYMLKINHALR